MKNSFSILLTLLLLSFSLTAQVGIGTTSPDPSAALDILDTTRGLLPPRLSTAERDAINGGTFAEGLTIYNTDINCLEVWNGSDWINLCNTIPPVAAEDCDNDISVGTGTIVQMFYDFDGNGTAEYSWCAREVGIDTDNADGDSDPATGSFEQIWLDRNLGAFRRATSSNDAQGYGDSYQWGRAMDGHQKRYQLSNDPVEGGTGGFQESYANGVWTGSGNTSNNPSDVRFIAAVITPEGDWVVDNNDDRWAVGDNIPCPSGYTVPSLSDFSDAYNSFTTSAIDSPLALPGDFIGFRLSTNGFNSGLGGAPYWTRSLAGDDSSLFRVSDGGNTPSPRASGASVRCIKE